MARVSLARAAVLVLLLTLAAAARAQEVGSVAAVEGQAEVGRGSTWTQLGLNDRLSLGDRVRTRRPGRLRLVFQDDTVITIADDTEIVVAAPLFDPARRGQRSLFRLARGKLRALVSDLYREPGAQFEVETPTAAVGVRGTEFVIVYDPVAEVTDAVGVNDVTEVHGVIDRVGHAVFITTRELTQVARGQFPTPLRKLDETTFRQYLDGLEFIGGGQDESVTIGDLILSGGSVDQPERAESQPVPSFGEEALPGPNRRSFPQREEMGPPVDFDDSYLPALPDQPVDVLENPGDVGIEF